jgi:hypothetical protein
VSLEYDYLIAGAIVAHSVVVFLVGLGLRRSEDKRQKTLWMLTPGQAVAFPAIFLVISSAWYPSSLLVLLSYVVYSLVGAFVAVFEIPGYLVLDRYDDKIVDALGKTRDDLLALGVSFDADLLRESWSKRKEVLKPTHLYPLIDGFVSTCERLKNLDKTFWQLVLAEVNASIRSISERSKHPAPKLIDILSLSGLSFLIAEFLHLLG